MSSTAPPWVAVEKLDDGHILGDFQCGSEAVDAWLHQQARSVAHLVSTYVCLDEDGRVVAFFALRNVVQRTEGLASSMRAGAIDGLTIATLLAFMGTSTACRRGAGIALLREAYRVAAANHERIPVGLFVVEALNERLLKWYIEEGQLRQIPGELRLALPMKTVAKVVAALDARTTTETR